MNLLDLVVTISTEDKASPQIESLSTKSIAMGSAIGTTMGTLVGAGLQKAASFVVDFGKETINAGMNFDQAMSQVAATMGVTTNDIQDLTNYAKEMGATTAFSATEAADALNYMALAGYDSETSMAMLPNVLNLAAAGSMDLATASDMVTDSQTALGLSIDETNVLVDQMAQTSSKSNTSVQQLGDAILTVGGTAKNLSGGITEMNTVLGVLADNGIKGSEAGTHLRNVILSLSAPTDKAAETLDALGVSATDMEGNLRPIPDIMEDLNMAMDGLTQEEKTQALNNIFNKTDLASVNALLSGAANNVDGIAQALMDTGVSFQYFDDATVSAEEQARGMALGISEALGQTGGDVEQAARLISDTYGMSFEDAMKITEAGAGVIAETTDRFDELSGMIEDAAGAAEKMAQTQLDNLAGDMTLLQSATEGVQLELAAGAMPALRDMVQVGTDGLSEMAAKLQSGDLLGGFETLGTTVTQVASSFMNSLPQFVDAGMKMLGGFIQGFGEGLPQMIPALVGAVTGIAQALIQNIPILITAALELVKGLAVGLVNAIPVLIEAIPQLIQALVTALVSSAAQLIVAGVQLFVALVEAIPQVIPALIEALPQIIDAIVNGLIEAAPALLEAGMQILTAITEGIISAIPGLGAVIEQIITFFAELPGRILEFLVQIVTDVGTWIGELAAGAVEVGTQFVQAVITFISELPGRIAEFLSNIINNVVQWVATMIQNAQQAGSEFLNKVVSFITQLPGRIANFLANIISNVISWVANMIQNATQMGSQFLSTVINFFSQLPGNIANFLSTIIGNIASWVSNMISKAMEMGSQFLSTVQQKFGEVVSFFTQLPGRIIGAIGNAGSMLLNVGRQIIQGLISGITSMIGSAISAVTNAVGGIVNAAKSFLGIRSPSRVFAEIGDYSMQGLAEGFKEGSDEAAGALEDVLDDMSSQKVTVTATGARGAKFTEATRTFEFNITINAEQDAYNSGRKIAETIYNTMQQMELNYA